MKALKGIKGEVIVVDNDSDDDSIAFSRQLYPEVTFIENEDNLGFARANNQAILQAQGEYVVLLNPDTIINESLLKECISLLDTDLSIAATGVRMLNENGLFAPESRRGVPTPFTAFCKMSGLTRLFPKSRLFGRYYLKYLDEYKSTPIEIISGACMFIRKSVLAESGLLDEDFFMYGEDIDLSYRILKTGYKNYYIPTLMLHYKGESTQKNTYRYFYVFYEAMYIFFKKHYGNYNMLLAIPIRSAIYMKGVTEYVTRKVKGLLEEPQTPLEFIKTTRFLLKGSNRTLESMVAICEKYHLTFDVDENSAYPYDFIVYDVDAYSYDEILQELEQRAQHLHTRVHLATYSAQLRVIITAFYVFEE